ncbi:hypothetical protein BSLG_006581 [Batrachochytrium salamandrivorans]|nr:hypothetical protein BSLG_006581 [Batrachochytrium salamandrivorans]
MMRHGNARATSQLIQPQVVPAIIRIVCDTPHLVSGGASLDLLLEFWAMLVEMAYPIVSKSIAALATSNTPDAMALLQKLMLDVVAVPGDQNTRYLALLSIGEIGNRPTIHQYLPLLALKEVIEVSLTTESARSTMSPFVPTIWQVLFDKSDTELEDITRNTLRSLLTSTKQLLVLQLSAVRVVAIAVPRDLVKDSLIHIVEMGPFKHKIDTGLDTRKSAFECMYTLLDACFVNIEVDAFIQRAIAGIADPAHEIKLISHLMVQRLTVVAPAAISTFLDSIADMLKVTLTLKIVKCSGVRTRCSGAYSGMTQDDMPKFAELLKETKTPGAVCYDIFGSVQIEVAAATNVSSVSTSRLE